MMEPANTLPEADSAAIRATIVRHFLVLVIVTDYRQASA